MHSKLCNERISYVASVQGLLELGEMTSREIKESVLGGYHLGEWKLSTFLMAKLPEKKA